MFSLKGFDKVIFCSHIINMCIRIVVPVKTAHHWDEQERIFKEACQVSKFQHMPLMTTVAAKIYEKS